MTYEQALKKGEKAGASKAGPEEFLALLCKTLAVIHAINPALVFEGAKKQGLTAKQVTKLAADDPVGLGDLMFV
jgi:hypothetical protein